MPEIEPRHRTILWDVPKALARLEGRPPRLESAAASPFVSGHPSRVRWPAPCEIQVRVELQRLP